MLKLQNQTEIKHKFKDLGSVKTLVVDNNNDNVYHLVSMAFQTKHGSLSWIKTFI